MNVRKAIPGSELVTEVGLHLTRRPPILAFVDVTLWGTIVIRDLRILERQDGTRVLLMPRVQTSDGRWVTMAHPIQEGTRSAIESTVMRAYEEAAAAREAARAAARRKAEARAETSAEKTPALP